MSPPAVQDRRSPIGRNRGDQLSRVHPVRNIVNNFLVDTGCRVGDLRPTMSPEVFLFRKSRVSIAMTKKRKQKLAPKQPAIEESRTAEAATVAWMLSLMSTVAAECGGILVRLLIMANDASERLQVLSTTLLLVAFIAGGITVILTPVVSRLRRVAPPKAIVIVAYTMGVVPLATLVLISMMTN